MKCHYKFTALHFALNWCTRLDDYGCIYSAASLGMTSLSPMYII